MEQLYTVEQAAAILQAHPETIRDWLRSKQLTGVLAGRRWRIKESDLQAFLRKPEPSSRSTLPTPPSTPAADDPLARKAAIVARLRQMKDAGMTLKQIAAQLNQEHLPTLSGHGAWRAGTVGNLLAEGG
jgi:excisionase family DNA binding protein